MSLVNFNFLQGINSELGHKTRPDVVQYGTAGFRDKGDGLDFIVFRMGLLSVLRSKYQNGKVIGLMITASHNPEEDNGVKLVDPAGEMLEAKWEILATDLANADNGNLAKVLNDITIEYGIDWNVKARVYLGRDTRSSSPRLANAAKEAIKSLNGELTDYGIVTTPMLHFFVAETNAKQLQKPPSENSYYEKLSNAFKKLNSETKDLGNYTDSINFDGAHGVGSISMLSLIPHLSNLNVNISNTGNGKLNYMCGSDFVKINKRMPEGVPISKKTRYVSVDGDSDRLIYYYLSGNQFNLLDGDKIATLLVAHFIELLRASQLKLNLGLVQTAYANGASTDYITQVLKVPVEWTDTGVKHLHHKALEFDIGVYFEANGHGTVVYSENAISQIHKLSIDGNASDEQKRAATTLKDFIELTNQYVGDAISDMLLVETVLRARKWGATDWDACYMDLPNRLAKVTIKDRTIVKTTDAARKCLTPIGLQNEIDRLVSKYNKGRSFVRSSGTEDVVRVYAEADTQESADRLATEVSLAVFNLAGGIGQPPTV